MWSAKRSEILKRLWESGRSARQIAAELGGLTRSAVIGKLHRLGLEHAMRTQSAQPQETEPACAEPSAEVATDITDRADKRRAGRSRPAVKLVSGRGRDDAANRTKSQRPAARQMTDTVRDDQDEVAAVQPAAPPLADPSGDETESEPLGAPSPASQTDTDHGVGISLIDLGANDCRWVLGEGEDGLATYCGRPRSVHGGPYCDAHAERAYQQGSWPANRQRPAAKVAPRIRVVSR